MMPTQPETVGDVFTDAATVIRERGWCQLNSRLPSGEVCMATAINTSITATVWPRSAAIYKSFYSAIEQHLGTQRLTRWNDQPERTKTEVLKALESAAWTYSDQPLETPT